MPSLIDRLFPSSQPASPAEPAPLDVASPTPVTALQSPEAPAAEAPAAAAPAAAAAPRGVLDRLFPRQGMAGRASADSLSRPSPIGAPAPPTTNGAEPGAAGLVASELPAGEAAVQVTTPPADAAAGTCANCAAPLAPEQEWCLECGAEVARPEPGTWRMGLAVAGSLLVLAAIGFGIAYVALSDRSARDAALAGPPSPGQLSTPSPVSATPPATTTPVAPSLPPVTGIRGPLPRPAPAHTPVTPARAATPTPSPAVSSSTPTPTPSSSTTPSTVKTTTPRSTKPAKPKSRTNSSNVVKVSHNQSVRPISFDAGSAHGFPADSPGANSQAAGYAVDNNPGTAWFTTTPDTGIYVDAGVPGPIKSVSVTTTTPGFTAAIYGAVSGPPATLSSWTPLAGPATVASKQTFTVSSSGQYRYIMVYVSQLPPGGSRANVNELSVMP